MEKLPNILSPLALQEANAERKHNTQVLTLSAELGPCQHYIPLPYKPKGSGSQAQPHLGALTPTNTCSSLGTALTYYSKQGWRELFYVFLARKRKNRERMEIQENNHYLHTRIYRFERLFSTVNSSHNHF